MSAQGQIIDFIRSLNAEPGSIIPLTTNQVALQTGINSQVVSKTFTTLKEQKRIEPQRGKNGRDIVGIKVLDLEPRRKGPRAGRAKVIRQAEKHRRVRLAEPRQIVPAAQRRLGKVGVPTPMTDQYARAKTDFARIQSDLGDFIEAQFKPNPFAEEALVIRERLASMEAELIELRMTNEALAAENRGIIARKRTALADAAAQVEEAIEEQPQAAATN